MAKIVVKEVVRVYSEGGSLGGCQKFAEMEVINIECPDLEFNRVWDELLERGLIPERTR